MRMPLSQEGQTRQQVEISHQEQGQIQKEMMPVFASDDPVVPARGQEDSR
jgi:hypothetical protein